MESIVVKGAIVVGSGAADCRGPVSSIISMQLDFMRGATARVSNTRRIASPAAYVVLPEIGAGSTVELAGFLYLRTDAPITLRITDSNNVISVVPVDPVFMIAAPAATGFKLVEVMGTAQIEFCASNS